MDKSVQEVENVPEGRKIETITSTSKPSQRKRTKGKLTKKEQKRMKQTHGDIALLLAPPKPLEVRKHEKTLAKEVEVMEVVDEERRRGWRG